MTSQANAEQGGTLPDAQAGSGELIEPGKRSRGVEIVIESLTHDGKAATIVDT